MSKLFPDRVPVHCPPALRLAMGGATLLGLFLVSAPALATQVPKQHPVQGGAALRLANELMQKPKPPRKQKPPQGRVVPPPPAAPTPTVVTTTAPVAPPAPVSTAPVETPPADGLKVLSTFSPGYATQGSGGDQPVQGATTRLSIQSLSPATLPNPLGEVMPRTEELVASMKDPALPPDGLRTPEQAASPSCVAVTLSRDDRRANSTLVDLTGDGLIVTPVDNQRLQAVLDRAALNVALPADPVRHCLPQSVVRDMVRPAAPAERSSMSLVQTREGWRLAPAAARSAAAPAKRTTTAKAPASRPAPLPRPVASR